MDLFTSIFIVFSILLIVFVITMYNSKSDTFNKELIWALLFSLFFTGTAMAMDMNILFSVALALIISFLFLIYSKLFEYVELIKKEREN